MTETNPEDLVDADNRLLVDHFISALAEFPYDNYAVADFPVPMHDAEHGGPSELAIDMGHAMLHVVVGYVRERAQDFKNSTEFASGLIAQVLEDLASQMSVTERPDVPKPLA